MHQGGVGLEAHGVAHPQRRHTGKHPVLVAGQVAQHDGQPRLIEILGIVDGDADADRASPVGDLGQLGCQEIQDLLRRRRVMVGDVDQRQAGRHGVSGLRQLATQLGQHQGSRHTPLRVGGMAVGKTVHGQGPTAWWPAKGFRWIFEPAS